MSGVGTGRNTQLFLANMKAYVLFIEPIPGYNRIRSYVQYKDGGEWIAGFDPDINITTELAADTSAAVRSAVATKILAYAVTNELPSMTADDIVWLTAPIDADTKAASDLSISLQTSTGAVGTQVSSTEDSWVVVAGQVSTTATIAGNSAGDIIVEVAPTNSATAGDWKEWGRIGNSQVLTLALTLQSVQIVKGQVLAYVPAGHYIKARTSGSGTVSYTLNTVKKVL